MKDKKLILASASVARKQLLNSIGLKVKVLHCAIKESSSLKYGPAALVKDNALKKAMAVSQVVKEGVIIACDTIAVSAGKVFGKPKSFSDARNTLRQLSRRPHFVYTGVALFDKKKGKTLVDYEKTKVWMRKASPKEINKYLKKSKVFDKAGSFDIQGRGGLLIERIEGCFYNVVGLPLAKLFSMLKKLNVSILILLLFASLTLSGCASEYNIVTQQEDLIFFNTEKEINIGRRASDQIEQQFKLIQDPILLARVNSLGQKIVKVCDRKNLTYRFSILDEDSINAVALPGGFIYVNRGLIDFVKNDDELVGVLAHEVAHVVAKHSVKRLQAAVGFNFLTLLAAASGNARAYAGVNLAAISLFSAYSREDEMLADELSARYLRQAGFDPVAFISFLERLRDKKRNQRPRAAGFYARTHPYISERISIIKEEIGEELSFEDYINRTQIQ